MVQRKNTRINTLFSEAAYSWLHDEANVCNQSLAAMVRNKIELAKAKQALLTRIEHVEKVIKKSHSILADKIGKQ